MLYQDAMKDCCEHVYGALVPITGVGLGSLCITARIQLLRITAIGPLSSTLLEVLLQEL
jgi:hypothetical protein